MTSKRRSLEDFFYLLSGILLFVFAIELLTSSAGAVAPELGEFMGFINNNFNALGFGWIASYLMLSGYPVTVFGLTLFDSGAITEVSAFFIVNGSRLGASLIIILVGVTESLKNKELDIVDSTSLGFLTLLITYTIVAPAIVIGMFLLDVSILNNALDLKFLSIIDIIYGPIVEPILGLTGPFAGIVLALLSLYIALSIFEKPFHRMKIENFKSTWVNFLMERVSYSFLMGAVLTFFSQSVALSIGLIVPLYNRNFLQKRNLVPYIMGACVTTFGGTLVVAFLLGNITAINLTLVVILSNLIACTVYLLFYRKYYRFISGLTNLFLQDGRRLIVLLFFMFVIPFILLLAI